MNQIKNLALAILALAILVPVASAIVSPSRITATIQVTNAPMPGDLINFNGNDSRYAALIVTAPQREFATAVTAGGIATNLFNHLSIYRPAGTSNLVMTGSNTFTIQNLGTYPLAITNAGTWVAISFTTNIAYYYSSSESTNLFPMDSDDDRTIMKKIAQASAQSALNSVSLVATNLTNMTLNADGAVTTNILIAATNLLTAANGYYLASSNFWYAVTNGTPLYVNQGALSNATDHVTSHPSAEALTNGVFWVSGFVNTTTALQATNTSVTARYVTIVGCSNRVSNASSIWVQLSAVADQPAVQVLPGNVVNFSAPEGKLFDLSKFYIYADNTNDFAGVVYGK